MDDDIQAPRPALDWRLVLASIVAFWLFYVAVVTLRGFILEYPNQAEVAFRRGVVSCVGFALTIVYWLVLRVTEGRTLRTRVATAAAFAIPVAIVIAAINYYAFNIYDPGAIIDLEQKPPELRPTAVQEIADGAVNRYFFLIAWASFYLALSYARDMGLAERKAADFARAAQTAQLRALRYQVNPHFLFNTLNSLSALVMKGERALADTMIANLSTFYRTSLAGEPTEDVPLSEEVELQKLYLEIETVRFPSRLSVTIDMPAELGNAAVPGLILQPLVENAIKHGVARSTGQIVLTIAARREDDRLLLSVANSGDTVEDATGEPGIGLANVRERLRARFGEAATLDHGAQADGGYRATIVLPYAEWR